MKRKITLLLKITRNKILTWVFDSNSIVQILLALGSNLEQEKDFTSFYWKQLLVKVISNLLVISYL